MQYISYYQSPLGSMMLASDLYGLTGLWFVGDRFYAEHLSSENAEKETSVMTETKRWLDTYFSGQIPAEPPLIHLTGTAFQREVCEIMLRIPYGTTRTYGSIAEEIARRRNLRRMSAQAVGAAVGHNPVCIIVPCHRVVGAGGNLTGYGGGIYRKIKLLTLEKVDMNGFYIPKHGNAL